MELELQYEYEVKERDSFAKNFNMHHFQYQNLIVGISRYYYYSGHRIIVNTFDIETSKFTEFEEFIQVKYEELKNISYMFDMDRIILIDMINKQYSCSCNFPFMISEIDGNYITSCRDNDYYYIFHSKTMDYETGVFIFDIKNNSFNEGDFIINEKYRGQEDNGVGAAEEIYQSQYTNIFTALHHKDISTCCIYNRDIIINIEDKLCKYDIESNQLSLIIEKDINDMKIFGDLVFIKGQRNLDVYDIKINILTKNIIVIENGEYYEHWDYYNDLFIVMIKQQNSRIIKIYRIK